jgi:hypothetical protein
VVALASNDVWMVGDHSTEALVMHWDGSEWSIVEHPLPDHTSMGPITASSPTDVWAVSYSHYYPSVPTFLHWDGTEWSTVEAPAVPDASGGVNLNGGIDAVGACDVWAVGSSTSSSGNSTLTMRFGSGSTSGVESADTGRHALAAWPDPFDVSTTVSFVADGPVTGQLTVHDASGRKVTTLFAGEIPVGEHAFLWSGRSDSGGLVSPGIYFARLQLGTQVEAVRLMRMN